MKPQPSFLPFLLKLFLHSVPAEPPVTSGQSEVTADLADMDSAAAACRLRESLSSFTNSEEGLQILKAWIKLYFFAIHLYISCLLSISNQLPHNQ